MKPINNDIEELEKEVNELQKDYDNKQEIVNTIQTKHIDITGMPGVCGPGMPFYHDLEFGGLGKLS